MIPVSPQTFWSIGGWGENALRQKTESFSREFLTIVLLPPVCRQILEVKCEEGMRFEVDSRLGQIKLKDMHLSLSL